MAKSKSTITGLALAVLICGLLAGKASAALITETYGDYWINFPGWDNPAYTNDEIGDPKISKMEVTFDEDTRLLDSVSIYMEGRLTWDSLFINADWDGDWASYDQWDHYVYSKGTKDEFYDVIDPTNYDYTFNTEAGRLGHPTAIEKDDLALVYVGYMADSTGLTSYDGSVLTYSLASLGVILGDSYMIAYSPWCANDVIGSAPIPEPATMLLFGTGLAGLAGLARRRMRVA